MQKKKNVLFRNNLNKSHTRQTHTYTHTQYIYFKHIAVVICSKYNFG